MEKEKKKLSIEQRLKQFTNEENENNINKWLNDINELIKQADQEKEIEILTDLKNIILNSLLSYLDKEILDDDEPKIEKIKKRIDNIKVSSQNLNNKDIMFEIQNNFPKEEYIPPKENQKNILILSINPGSSQKEYQDDDLFNKRNQEVPLMYSIDTKALENKNNNLAKKIEKIKNKIKGIYIWPSYYDGNFDILRKIEPLPKYYWLTLPKNKLKEYFNNMNNDPKGKKLDETDIKNLEEMIDVEQKKIDKNTPLVYFNDLFWIADSDQKQLLTIINKYYEIEKGKKKIDEYVKEIFDLYIEKYSLKMIVITNAKAANFVINAIKDTIEENETKEIDDNIEKNAMFYYKYNKKEIPVILSGYIVGGMDNYSKKRLTRDIAKIWEEKISKLKHIL